MKTATLLIFGFLLGLNFLTAQPRGHGSPAQSRPDSLSEEQVPVFLDQFRNARLNGDFFFIFEFRHMPRRGEDILFSGRMMGTWNDNGALTRVQLSPLVGEQDNLTDLLIQNGPDPQVLHKSAEGKVVKLSEDALFHPLYEQALFNVFDLQMPFFYWDRYEYMGATKVKGRPAHRFLFFPPESMIPCMGDVRVIEVALDSEFLALLDINYQDAEGKDLKSLRINSFKKVDQQWIVKTIDLIDHKTRDKTRFKIIAAAVGLNLGEEPFKGENLNQPVSGVPEEILKFL